MSEDFGAWWGDLPCALGASPPSYTRTRGLEPAVATVAFPRRFFSESLAPLPVEDPFRIRELQPASLVGRVHEDRAVTFTPIARPPFFGDLVIAQGSAALGLRSFVARQLYLVDAVIPDPQHGDDSLVQFVLSDIRRFWNDYGHITKSWNVGLPQGDARRVGADGLTIVRPGDRIYVAHTAKDAGTRATPLREVLQDLLNELPGRLQIADWPDQFLADKPPPEVRCWGAQPKEVIRAVLEAFSLEIDVGEDMAVRFAPIGQGDVGEATPGGSLAAHDPASGEGAWQGHVVADGNRYARRPSHRPTNVVVIGDRTVRDVAVDFLTPVLVYTDDVEGTPHQTVVLEVTPDNLQALARGGADPGEAEILLASHEDRARLSVLLGAKDRKVIPAASTGPTEAQPDAVPADDGHLWQRLPFHDGGAWSASLPYLSDRIRQLLRQQLWRYYQVPDSLRRLLPLLKRAARDYKGDRLEPRCEAFTFRATSTRIKIERDEPDAPNSTGKPNDIRIELVKKLEETQKAIASMEERKKRLRGPSAREVVDAVAIVFKGGHATATGKGDKQLAEDIRRSEGAFNGFLESWAQIGRGWIRAYVEEPAKFVGADTLAGWAKEYAGGLSSDDVETRIAQIDLELKDLRDEEAKIVAELNPRGAKERELGAIEAQIRSAAASGGIVPRALRTRAEALRQEIAGMVQEEAEKQPPADDEAEFEERVFHLNLVRDEVPFRVVDENLGIIEVLSESLPGWLADPMVPDPEATWFVPMPVRLTFGTWNRHDPEVRTGEGSPNFYPTVSVAMLRGMFPQSAGVFADLGDRLPADVGEGQIVFTFSALDQESGTASIASPAWRILYDDPENPLRLLVLLPEKDPQRPGAFLPPASNYDELLKRARPFAKAALSAPAELDAGSLTISGPRTVHLNGRMSATEVRLLDAGKGFVTEVSFDSDAAPLPGVDGPVKQSGPVRLVFGIDVEQGRND